MMWIVKLLKTPIQNDFKGDYFPRKLRYWKEAVRLQQEVGRKGGLASVEKESKR